MPLAVPLPLTVTVLRIGCPFASRLLTGIVYETTLVESDPGAFEFVITRVSLPLPVVVVAVRICLNGISCDPYTGMIAAVFCVGRTFPDGSVVIAFGTRRPDGST